MTNKLDQKTITNLYALATSNKIETKTHHRWVPMQMFGVGEFEGQEVVLPMTPGTPREIQEAEANARATTKSILGDVEFKNQGYRLDEAGNKIFSDWDKVYNKNRKAEIIATCAKVPGDLTKQYFDNAEQVLAMYPSDDVLDMVFDHWYTVKYTQPHFTLLDEKIDADERFQDAIDKIKAAGEDADFFLNSFTTHSSNQLIKYLVSKVQQNSTNTNGGSGVLSNSSTTKEQTQN
jgi:hypothetical protein